jgi:hypothetical protein
MNANAENLTSTTTPTLFDLPTVVQTWKRSRQTAMALTARLDLILSSPHQLDVIEVCDLEETCEALMHHVRLELGGIRS